MSRERRGLYKHSVTELDTDTESNGYASISFSDSDTASETPEVSYTLATSSEKLGFNTQKYTVVPKEALLTQEMRKTTEALTLSIEDNMASVSGPDNTHKMPRALDHPVKPRYTKPNGYVGFSSLPDQVYKRALKRGFEFNLMVVGESGLGKSTLVNSMFLTDIYSSSGSTKRMEQTTKVETHCVQLEEDGVQLALTVVDTPGFGDCVDNSECWGPVTGYIQETFQHCLEAETRVHRTPQLPDCRVHACLYFLAPTGHGLREIDVQAMKMLGDKVNVIPVIGKADTFTTEELISFKHRVTREMKESCVQTFLFNAKEEGGEEEEKECGPYAVVGSNTVVETGGRRVRGRQYPWGVVDIEDPAHCDFSLLRRLLLSTHTQHLVDRTKSVHYENFRMDRLSVLASLTLDGVVPNKNPLAVIEDQWEEHQHKVDAMENEMEHVFSDKLEEKVERMRREEQEKRERVEREQEGLERERREVERRRGELQKEKEVWEGRTGVSSMVPLRSTSSSSLTKTKKHLSLNILPFKFGRS